MTGEGATLPSADEGGMRSKNTVLISLGILLVIASLVSTSRIDTIQATGPDDYPLFYVSHLPPTYFIAVVYLALCSILTKNWKLKVALVLLLALLLEVTPTIMLANPWVPDQYPFIAESVHLAKDHHVSAYHYLDTTPGLALTFAGLILVTNIPPLSLSILATFFGVFAAFLVILIGRKMGTDGALCGLLFLAFNFLYQTNIFHRQTFSFLLFLFSVLILLHLLTSRKSSHSIAYTIVLFAVILTHPGTSAFLVISLIVAALGLRVVSKNRALIYSALLSAVVFVAYNVYVSLWDFRNMIRFVNGAMNEFLFGDVGQAPGLGYLSGYTQLFSTLMNVRLVVVVIFLGLASMIALNMILKRRGLKSVFVSLLHFGLMMDFMVFMFGGAIYRLRPLLFLIVTSTILIGCLPIARIGSSNGGLHLFGRPLPRISQLLQSKTLRVPLKHVSIGCLIALLLCLPVLRYSGLPYLHPTSEELSGKLFLDRYYSYDSPIHATEKNLAYTYSLDLLWLEPKGEPDTILIPEEDPPMNRSFLLVNRYATRDGYWVTNVSFTEYLEYLLIFLPRSHNLVYQSDGHDMVFLERS